MKVLDYLTIVSSSYVLSIHTHTYEPKLPVYALANNFVLTHLFHPQYNV